VAVREITGRWGDVLLLLPLLFSEFERKEREGENFGPEVEVLKSKPGSSWRGEFAVLVARERILVVVGSRRGSR